MERDTRNQLRRLAESQRGLFSAAQAAQLGVSHAALCRAASAGYLRRSRHGVYAMGGLPVSRWEPMVAAALSAGPQSVISHSTAASAHRLYGANPIPSVIELTVPPTVRRRLDNVIVHRRRPLVEGEWVTKYGARMTSAARTLVDLAGRLELPVLERTLDEGLLQRALALTDVRRSLDGAPANLAGRGALEDLLALRMEGPTADSALEIKVFHVLRELAPFEAHYQVDIGRRTYLLDAAWPHRRVAAEIVGRSHRVVSRSAFDRERRKLNDLVAAGWRIAHLTAAMSPDEMIDAVQALLRPGVPEAG